MQQILYTSTSTIPGDGADLARILNQSRHNNALDGIRGFLLSDGTHFIQVIEGPRASVSTCFERIKTDDRHHSIELMLERKIQATDFGTWTMLHRRQHEPANMYQSYINRLLINATSEIRMFFKLFVAASARESFNPPNPDIPFLNKLARN